MGQLSDHLVQQVREHATTLEVARILNLQGHKKEGRRHLFFCPAPDHSDENRQNLNVYDDGGFNCFCCGFKGGDGIALYMGARELDFQTAVRELADTFGVSVKGDHLDEHWQTRSPPKLSEFASLKQLPVDYLRKIGVTEIADGLRYSYRDCSGKEVWHRKRVKLTGKQHTFSPAGKGKSWPQGCEGLKLVREAEEAYVVEGESCYFTAAYHGLPVIGIPGATMAKQCFKKLTPRDLEGIHRFMVIQEPGKAGTEFPRRVAEALKEIGVTEAQVLAVKLPTKDLSELHMKKKGSFQETLRDAVAGAKLVILESGILPGFDEDPIPLQRELPPADPFPIDCLPPVLADACRAIEDIVQAPDAICAQSVLAVTSLATQDLADVELPHGATKPISCFFVTIGLSGERKTTADDLALEPVSRREDALREIYRAELQPAHDELEAWNAERQRILRDHKGHPGKDSKQKALTLIGPEPTPPLRPVLICPEPTLEGLFESLETGQPSMGLFSDEGAMFLGGHAMQAERKMKTAAGLSKLWDGAVLTDVRRKHTRTLVGRRVSLHLMAQPGVAEALFTDDDLQDQGLLSRLLVAFPESRMGSRMCRDPKPESVEALSLYNLEMEQLLRRERHIRDGTVNELDLRVMRLDQDARASWIRFSDEVETQMKNEFVALSGFANKIAEHAARLAGIFALVENSLEETISKRQMSSGIQTARFYLKERLRLVGGATVDPDYRKAKELLRWLQNWSEPAISIADLCQRGPASVGRTKPEVSKAVAILEEHGYLRKISGDFTVQGKKRRRAYEIRKV